MNRIEPGAGSWPVGRWTAFVAAAAAAGAAGAVLSFSGRTALRGALFATAIAGGCILAAIRSRRDLDEGRLPLWRETLAAAVAAGLAAWIVAWLLPTPVPPARPDGDLLLRMPAIHPFALLAVSLIYSIGLHAAWRLRGTERRARAILATAVATVAAGYAGGLARLLAGGMDTDDAAIVAAFVGPPFAIGWLISAALLDPAASPSRWRRSRSLA